MANGWFDAFRDGNSPTFYGENRTSVNEDSILVALYIIFLMFMFAFLVILPGIRKERFKTFFAVTISLFVGTVILVSLHGSEWHVAEARLADAAAPTSALGGDPDMRQTTVGVNIGLNSFNVTLKGSVENGSSKINYNERVSWYDVDGAKSALDAALVRGLPSPILTVAEYLSADKEGFVWGRCYRNAGYYSHILMWTAFTVWLLSNILFCMVIRYGAYSLVLTGTLLLITNGLYTLLLPKFHMNIHLDGAQGDHLSFRFGWCYWLVLCTGVLCMIVGAGIALTDVFYPQRLTIIFEMDQEERKRRDQLASASVKRGSRGGSLTGGSSAIGGGLSNHGYDDTSSIVRHRQGNNLSVEDAPNGKSEQVVVLDIGKM